MGQLPAPMIYLCCVILNKRIHFFLIVWLLSFEGLHGQTIRKWTLQECIDSAIANNYQARQLKLQSERNKAALLQSKANLLPSLNGSANHTYNKGRRIDPFTNQFANTLVLSQNFSLSGNLTLFNGFQNTNSIKASDLGLKASSYANIQADNDIALNVANAFLQVLLAEEVLEIAGEQVKLSMTQAERARLLYESGRSSKGDVLQIESQLASEQLNQVNASSRYELALLSLAQLITLESSEGFSIQKPDFSKVDMELPPYDVKEVFVGAVEQFPAVRSAEYNFLSQQALLKSIKGGIYPTLNAFGAIGSGYSGLSKTQTGTSPTKQYIGDFQGSPLYLDVNLPVYDRTPYSDQLSQNFNRTAGFVLNVPLFNNFRVRTQIANQKIALENARLQKLIARNNLRRDIQTAWLDAKSSLERYYATKKATEALSESFAYVQQRFEVGMVTAFEYNTAKNQLFTARSNLSQAMYEFILRAKILDYYRGKPIKF